MKYVVMQIKKHGIIRELPIIFPEALSHCDVAAALERHCPELKGSKPVSAGFLSSMSSSEPKACHGESLTLGKLKSRGEVDDRLMVTLDYTHGIVS